MALNSRRVLSIAVPMALRGVLGTLTLAVDTVMVSQLPEGGLALQAIGYCAVVVGMLSLAMRSVSMGVSMGVGRLKGQREHLRVEQTRGETITMAGLIWLVAATIGGVGAPFVLQALGATGAALSLGADYLRPYMALGLAEFVTLGLSAWLYGVGDAKLPMYTGILVNLLNLPISYLLMYGGGGIPAMGIAGSALGTGIASWVGLLATVIVLRRRKQITSAVLRPRRPTRLYVKQVMRMGIPGLINIGMIQSFETFQLWLLSTMSATAVAAVAIGRPMLLLGIAFSVACARATMILVAQSGGRGGRRAMRTALNSGLWVGASMVAALGLVIAITAQWLPALLGAEAGSELSELSVQRLLTIAIGMPLFCVSAVYQGSLIPMGAARTSIMLNAAGTMSQLALAVVLGVTLNMGPLGVWLGAQAGFAVKVIAGGFLSRRALRAVPA